MAGGGEVGVGGGDVSSNSPPPSTHTSCVEPLSKGETQGDR